MFHMLSCFNLKPEISLERFHRSIADFTTHMVTIDLVDSNGPIGRRQRHGIMDTDTSAITSTSS